MDRIEKKRTIYFVWNYLNWGGAQIYFLAIMKAARDNWNIVVLLPKGSSGELLGFLNDVGAKCEFLKHSLDNQPARSIGQKLHRQIVRIRSETEIYRRLRKVDVKNSVIHIEVAPWQSWQLLALLSLMGANVFITLHNFLPGGRAFRRAIWKARTSFVSRLRSITIFASNKDARERFRGWFTKNFHDSIEVTYTSVDPVQIAAVSDIDRVPFRAKFGIEADAFVVLCVGQFIDRKGRWVFLDAAANLKARGEDITYVWLMPHLPDDDDIIEIEKRQLGTSFRPILSSDVGTNRIDILKFFKIADVFALASYVEGLPIALLEAMALGIPSVSTNVFAIPEAVIDKETGILIEPGDSTALAESILRLKNDSDLRKSLSESGSEFALKNFDERVAAKTVIRSYQRCFSDG
jgi:glycosyltransferase involved in cell wall biosynthesis